MTEDREPGVTPVERIEKDEAATPVGDFMAQVASAAAVIFTFLTFYTMANNADEVIDVLKGYQTAYGIIILIVAALTFIFATAVLWSKFVKKEFWLMRSPGWAYGAAAGVIIIVSILAIVFPKSGYDVSYSALILEFFAAIFIAIGGMLKF